MLKMAFFLVFSALISLNAQAKPTSDVTILAYSEEGALGYNFSSKCEVLAANMRKQVKEITNSEAVTVKSDTDSNEFQRNCEPNIHYPGQECNNDNQPTSRFCYISLKSNDSKIAFEWNKTPKSRLDGRTAEVVCGPILEFVQGYSNPLFAEIRTSGILGIFKKSCRVEYLEVIKN